MEAFVGILVDTLNSMIQKEHGLLCGIATDMQKLSSLLSATKAVLEDAEQKQFTDKAIQIWFQKLNSVAYEIDDVLDDYAAEPQRSRNSEFHGRIGTRMKEILEKFNAIADERIKLGLCDQKHGSYFNASRETGSMVTEPEVLGRDEEKEQIVHILMKEKDREDQNVSVPPIVGLGGLGKTTLAQLRKLQGLLRGKRYLVVLDDVWNENPEEWEKLKSVLECGSRGNGHCPQEAEEYPNLVVIGKEIVKKGGGVPLAAKALGGFLRFKREENEWNSVKCSEIWNLPQDTTYILPALRLSYLNLPVELRGCFAYCAAFPKGYGIEIEEVIHLWMANGLISSNETMEVEDVGVAVLTELYYRSLFQAVEEDEFGNALTFKLHDLVHDLARSAMEANDSPNQMGI
ncbi:putative disease resistance protein RGA1 [Coffea eugenioides]|uniref:putative disease resistance protein RGA1 n=1 Tax=Coffea eugenioides TaxID=49369 RepID=UPI000F615962|nr:putative disease resistance protein RGA1 [Coffea eugenioides]